MLHIWLALTNSWRHAIINLYLLGKYYEMEGIMMKRKVIAWFICICMVVGIMCQNTVVANAGTQDIGIEVTQDNVSIQPGETHTYTCVISNLISEEITIDDFSVIYVEDCRSDYYTGEEELTCTYKDGDENTIALTDIEGKTVSGNGSITVKVTFTIPDDYNSNSMLKIDVGETGASSAGNSWQGLRGETTEPVQTEFDIVASCHFGYVESDGTVTNTITITNNEESALRVYDVALGYRTKGSTDYDSHFENIIYTDGEGNNLTSSTIPSGETYTFCAKVELPEAYTDDYEMWIGVDVCNEDKSEIQPIEFKSEGYPFSDMIEFDVDNTT